MIQKKIRELIARHLRELELQNLRDIYAWRDSYRACPATAHLHPNSRRGCSDCVGKNCQVMANYGLDDEGNPLPFKDRPFCDAQTRIGAICANRVVPGKIKCRLHGGKSTGPKTVEGKARISEAQRQRWVLYRKLKISSDRSQT